MTSPKRYRKKPVVIEAMQHNPPESCEAVHAWTHLEHHIEDCHNDAPLFIPTLEGLMEASPGDWIIKGVQGEFYPCKPDIFAVTYEEADK
jgi:hypothetical protein